ncbi:hypothetical protein HF682_17605, partial [Leeia sp. IMCC25680]|nr:hypothetical protein [Leeia aquatica]
KKNRDLQKKAYMEAAATVIGQITGGLAGGRDSAIVGGNVALNADQNNRQLHVREMELIRLNRKAFLNYLNQRNKDGAGLFTPMDKISEEEAEYWLANAARANVDSTHMRAIGQQIGTATTLESRLYFAAKEYLANLVKTGAVFTDESGVSQRYFTATADDFKNGLKYVNAESPLYREFMATNFLEAYLPKHPTPADQALYDKISKERATRAAVGIATAGLLWWAGNRFGTPRTPIVGQAGSTVEAPIPLGNSYRLAETIPVTGEAVVLMKDTGVGNIKIPAGSKVAYRDGLLGIKTPDGKEMVLPVRAAEINPMAGNSGTVVTPAGQAQIASSNAIKPGNTVRLTQNVVTPNGQLILAGSVVTQVENTLRVVMPNGAVIVGAYNKGAAGGPLALPDMPINRMIINEDGLKQVNVLYTPLEAQRRLNTKDVGGSNKYRPAEAAAGAQLEDALGAMKRYEPSLTQGANDKNPDFVIIDGPYKGKTVDAMYTTGQLTKKEIDGINKFFEKNMILGKEKENILNHLDKADFVPVDFRVLTQNNQQIFMNYIGTLPAAQRAKIIIVK